MIHQLDRSTQKISVLIIDPLVHCYHLKQRREPQRYLVDCVEKLFSFTCPVYCMKKRKPMKNKILFLSWHQISQSPNILYLNHCFKTLLLYFECPHSTLYTNANNFSQPISIKVHLFYTAKHYTQTHLFILFN